MVGNFPFVNRHGSCCSLCGTRAQSRVVEHQGQGRREPLENVVTSRDRIVTDHILWGLLDVMIARADRGAVEA